MRWIILAILLLTLVFFRNIFLQGLLPIPSDIITGLYYPWLDYKWGNVVGVAVKNPLMSDVPSLIYPWRTLAADFLLHFEWPLWNQYSFAGASLLGNWQSAPLSPSALLMLIFGNVHGWTLGIILQPLLAMWFMYIWLKNKQLNTLPSLLGGILYAFNGFQITWLYYNTHGWVLLWLPLILLSIDKVFAGKTKWAWWLSLWITLSILSGYPILLVYEGIIIVTYLLIKFVGNSVNSPLPPLKIRGGFPLFLKERVRVSSSLILSLILALGLSAIQWLPGLQTIQQSIHHLDSSTLEAIGQGYLPWPHLITTIAPDFFGNPTTGNYWGLGYYDNFAFYISVGALILALIAWFTLPTSLTWLGITFLGFLMATHNPIGTFLSESLPFLNQSIPTRSLFLVVIGVSISAAYGLQTFSQSQKQVHRLVVFSTLIGLLTSIGILWWMTLRPLGFRDPTIFTHCPDTYSDQWGKQLVCSLHPKILAMEEMHQYLEVAQRNLILPTILSLITSVLVIVVILVSRHSREASIRRDDNQRPFVWTVMSALIVLIIVADLFRYGWKYLPFTSSNYLYPSTKITNWLLKQKSETSEPFRIEFGETLPPNTWIPYRLESPTGYDALAPLRYVQFLHAIGSNNVTGSISRFPTIGQYDSRLFELTNTKYVLALKYNDKWDRSPDGTRVKEIYERNYFKPVFNYGTVTILENQRLLPRAWVVRQPSSRLIEDDSQVINHLLDPQTDFRSEVIFDTLPGDWPIVLDYLDTEPVEAQITWQKSEGQSRRLQVITPSSGYLVLLENYDPGWVASISNSSGEENPIPSREGFSRELSRIGPSTSLRRGVFHPRRANFTFMALPVTAGENEILLEYKPVSFQIGLVISFITLIIWLSIILYRNKRNAVLS